MTIDELLHMLNTPTGPVATKRFPDGRVCEVVPMSYGKFRLVVGDGGPCYSAGY